MHTTIQTSSAGKTDAKVTPTVAETIRKVNALHESRAAKRKALAKKRAPGTVKKPKGRAAGTTKRVVRTEAQMLKRYGPFRKVARVVKRSKHSQRVILVCKHPATLALGDIAQARCTPCGRKSVPGWSGRVA